MIQLNRKQRREQSRVEKLNLTKKVRQVRGRTFYGGVDVTNMMQLGIFKHAYTAVKAIRSGLTPKSIKELQKNANKSEDNKSEDNKSEDNKSEDIVAVTSKV